MDSILFARRLRDYLPSMRRLGLFVAAVAVAAMGIVSLAVNVFGGDANEYGTRPVVVATDRNNTPATSTPAIPSAGARVIPQPWQGGGWPGLGPFHGGGWPGQ